MRHIASNNHSKTDHHHHIKAVSFQPVSFWDAKQERQIIVLYSLGEDGIIREFTNGQWTGFPIEGQEQHQHSI